MAWPIRWSLLVVSALEGLYPVLSSMLGVKWPNDIMHGDAKLAGILVSRQRACHRWWCVAGVGLNLFGHSALSLDRPVTDLQHLGVRQPDPEQIVTAIVDAAFHMLSTPKQDQDTMNWQSAYRARDIAASMQVCVIHPTTGKTMHTGINRGISPTGELILDIDGAAHRIAVGELSLRPGMRPSV